MLIQFCTNLASANKIPADSVNPCPSNGAVDKGYTFAPVENNAGCDDEIEVVEIKDDKRRGADKRKVYKASFKAQIIQDYDDGTGKKELSDKYGVNFSMIWKGVKQKEVFISEATKGNKKM